MRRLILLRHAKAVAKAADDFDRALSGAGRDEMQLVSAALAADGLRPDLALVSPAARTRETWSLAGLHDVPVRFEEAIYSGEADALLGLITATPDEVATLMVVGHNPAIEELAAALADPEAERKVGYGLPTAALVVLAFPAETWAEVAAETGTLVMAATPATLGPAA